MRSPSDAGRRKIYLLGDGISYSRSPAMHNAAFQALGMDWTYDLLDVSPAQLRGAVAELRAQDVGGANVTIPYKQVVMDQLDTIAPDAVREGAVIDLVYVSGGTPLVRKARSLGLRTVDGWEVLLSQGAISFLLWTGQSAPLDAMRETLKP